MTERERLIEVFKKINYRPYPNTIEANLATQFSSYALEHIIDKLLENKCHPLPCDIGDTVYTNCRMQGWYFREKDKPYKAKIVFIGLNGVDNFMNVDFGNGHMLQFPFSEIGKTVFLTEEEALKARENK